MTMHTAALEQSGDDELGTSGQAAPRSRHRRTAAETLSSACTNEPTGTRIPNTMIAMVPAAPASPVLAGGGVSFGRAS